MTATLAAPPEHLRASAPPTLDALLVEAWHDISAGSAVECPICAGPLQPRWTAAARVVGGRCEDCGTTLE